MSLREERMVPRPTNQGDGRPARATYQASDHGEAEDPKHSGAEWAKWLSGRAGPGASAVEEVPFFPATHTAVLIGTDDTDTSAVRAELPLRVENLTFHCFTDNCRHPSSVARSYAARNPARPFSPPEESP